MSALEPGSVAVVFGTRPEMIKLAGVVALLAPAARVVHTGQHYSEELDGAILADLGLPPPEIRLEIGGASRGHQIGEATRLLDEHFSARRPRAVVTQGDTNSTLAAALAANAQAVPLVHVEAGLRSFDRALPEEHNRTLTDHLADLCCAPTETSRANLAAEGIQGGRVEVTGNTVVDAVIRLLPDPMARRSRLEAWGLEPNGYVLATFHRNVNVDHPRTLASILTQLSELPLPVVFPVHPRTVASVERFGLTDQLRKLRTIPPLGYREFLALAAECAFLASDSGGILEEASVLKRPVLTVRSSTERPEVEGTFATLVGPGREMGEVGAAWAADIQGLHRRLEQIPTPYGDGRSSERIVVAIDRLLSP